MAKKNQQNKRQEVTQLLSQAAQNGNLGRKEFERIVDAGGNADRVLQRAVQNKGLTINSGVVNQYNKGTYNPREFAMRNMSDKVFGAGFGVNPVIQQIRTAGKLDPKSTLFISSKGTSATVLPKSMFGGGGGGKAPVTAPATADPVDTSYSPEPMDVGSGMDFGGGGMDGGFNVPDNSAIPDPSFSPGGAGFNTDAGATGFRRKRSSAALKGLTTKGPGQLKISGQSSKSSGLNIGI